MFLAALIIIMTNQKQPRPPAKGCILTELFFLLSLLG